MIDLDKYQELLTLLAEAYEHYFAYGDGYAKSSEGHVALIVPPYYWQDDNPSTGRNILVCFWAIWPDAYL